MTKTCLPSLQRVNFTYTLVQLIYWSLFAAFAGYQTALLLGRGFTSGQAGVFAAIRCLSGIVAQPLLGGWADRHRAIPLKWILNVCFALALAVNAVFYFTRPGFWGTAAIFVALGALELNAYPLLDSMAVQFINAGMEVNYSLGRGLGSFAYAVSCVVLGRQSTAFGVESVLWTHAALLVLLMAVVACCPTAPVVSHASVPQAEPPPLRVADPPGQSLLFPDARGRILRPDRCDAHCKLYGEHRGQPGRQRNASGTGSVFDGSIRTSGSTAVSASAPAAWAAAGLWCFPLYSWRSSPCCSG